jgi:hypothetical protein
MNILPILSEIIHKKVLLNALKTMDFSEKDAKNELEYHINRVKNLPETIKAYRILSVNDKKDINMTKIGSHFALNRSYLVKNHSFSTGSGEKYYIITANIPKNEVNIQETIHNNILYPQENEITVKNKGKNVEIVSIKEIKP